MDQFYYTTRALSNPEILRCILGSLPIRCLCRPARVNREWFNCATDLIWQNGPLDQLLNIVAKRRQLYAAKIKSVDIFSDESPGYYTSLARLEFPNLQAITMEEYYADEMDYAFSLVFGHPSVNTVNIYDCYLNDAYLDFARETWPNLRRFELHGLGHEVTKAGLMRFISAYPSVQFVDLIDSGSSLPINDMLKHYAQQPELKILRMSGPISLKAIQDIASEVSKPFARLKELDIGIPSRGIPLLLEPLQNLGHLELTVFDVDIPVLSKLARLSQLWWLTVIFPMDVELPRAEVLSLCALSKLQHLAMYTKEQESIVCRVESPVELDFGDADFLQLVSSFPALHTLILNLDCALTAKSMIHLVDHCPHLRYCTLPSDIDLAGLHLDTRPGCAFPKLITLQLNAMYAPANALGNAEAFPGGALIDAVAKHFPSLCWFQLGREVGCCAEALMSFTLVTEVHRKRDAKNKLKFQNEGWISPKEYEWDSDDERDDDGTMAFDQDALFWHAVVNTHFRGTDGDSEDMRVLENEDIDDDDDEEDGDVTPQ